MAERVGNGADRGAFHDGQRVVREPGRALRERPEHGLATSRELVTNTAACNDHRSLGAAEQDGPFRRSRSPLHAVMAPVFRLVLVPAAMDAVRQWKYKPFLLNGKPLLVETIITVKFRL